MVKFLKLVRSGQTALTISFNVKIDDVCGTTYPLSVVVVTYTQDYESLFPPNLTFPHLSFGNPGSEVKLMDFAMSSATAYTFKTEGTSGTVSSFPTIVRQIDKLERKLFTTIFLNIVYGRSSDRRMEAHVDRT